MVRQIEILRAPYVLHFSILPTGAHFQAEIPTYLFKRKIQKILHEWEPNMCTGGLGGLSPPLGKVFMTPSDFLK